MTKLTEPGEVELHITVEEAQELRAALLKIDGFEDLIELLPPPPNPLDEPYSDEDRSVLGDLYADLRADAAWLANGTDKRNSAHRKGLALGRLIRSYERETYAFEVVTVSHGEALYRKKTQS